MKVIQSKTKQQDIPNSSQYSRYPNPATNFIISILRRLEFLGLYSILKVLPSLGRRSSTSNYIRVNQIMKFCGGFSATFLFLISFFFVFPINQSALKAQAAPSQTRDTSLSISIGDSINLEFQPTSSEGSFNSATMSFGVSTDNFAGYNLSIKAATTGANATKLINADDNTKVIDSITESISEATFSGISNTEYNNKWGFLPSKLNSAANTDYLPSPTYDNATVLNVTECANNSTSCPDATDSYTITLGARVSFATVTGTYSNSFNIMAVGNINIYEINYYANDGANGANTSNMPVPNPQVGAIFAGQTYTNISNRIPTQSTTPIKVFVGWCTVQPTMVDGEDTCNNPTDGAGVIYQPNSQFIFNLNTEINRLNLYAMWGPAPVYSIVYNGNNATGGSMVSDGVEITHTNVSEGDNVDLVAPNYRKTGYGFVGWSPSATATIGGDDPIYGPNETIIAPSYSRYGDGNGRVILYAVWLQKNPTYTMQTFDYDRLCDSMPKVTRDDTTGAMIVPVGSIIALEDIRDNDVYTVAKLADDQCWMLENLRLDDTANITVSNTQSHNNSFGQFFTGLPESSNTGWLSNTSNNLYPISLNLSTYTLPQLNTNNTNSSISASYNNNSSFSQWYSYGNYYSWAAAVADTGPTTNNNEHKATTSICPSGWHLPEGGDDDNASNSEFRKLVTLTVGAEPNGLNGTKSYYSNNNGETLGTKASNIMRAFPNNMVYSGYWYNSTTYYRGSYGYYWSSSAQSTTSAYRANFNNALLYPGTSDVLKNYGLPIRCVTI